MTRGRRARVIGRSATLTGAFLLAACLADDPAEEAPDSRDGCDLVPAAVAQQALGREPLNVSGTKVVLDDPENLTECVLTGDPGNTVVVRVGPINKTQREQTEDQSDQELMAELSSGCDAFEPLASSAQARGGTCSSTTGNTAQTRTWASWGGDLAVATILRPDEARPSDAAAGVALVQAAHRAAAEDRVG